MKNKSKQNIDYPLINKLGLIIHEKPYPHVRGKDLRKALKKHKITRQFNKYFGCQTCLALNDGDSGIYPYDCEAVLVRIFTGELTGTQLNWD